MVEALIMESLQVMEKVTKKIMLKAEIVKIEEIVDQVKIHKEKVEESLQIDLKVAHKDIEVKRRDSKFKGHT